MKTYHSLHITLLIATAITWGACSKQEQPIEEPFFSNIAVKILSTDTFLLELTVDEEVLGKELAAPALEDYLVPVKYLSTRHRFRLFDYYRNKVVTDTFVTYRPGYTMQVTFFQQGPGAPLQLMGRPANEAPAPEGFGKIAICYTFPPLPDLVKAVVHNSPNNDGKYEPSDSFMLRKGEFSKYFLARYSTNKARVYLYTADAERKLVADITNFQFDSMNPDFTGYLFRNSNSGALPAFLEGEKLY